MLCHKCFFYYCLCVFVTATLALCQSAYAGKEKNDSGLPIPRFVSLKSSEVNVRSGPGTRYPINWIYRRDGLPVEVVEEFDYWRKIKDIEESTGWVHKGMVEGSRNIIIKGKQPAILFSEADEKAKAVLKVESGVVGKLLECLPEWCRVQINGRKAWLKKNRIYGVYSNEIYKR